MYWIAGLLVSFFFYLFERLFPYLHITFRLQLYCNSFIQQLHNSCVSAQTCITRQLVIPLGWRNLWKNVHLTIERQEQAAQNQEKDRLQKLPMRCCKKWDIYGRAKICVCVAAVGVCSAEKAEEMHLCPTLSVPGCHVGNVQLVSGRNGPPGVLQMERRHLCFYWETLDFLIREQVKTWYFPAGLVGEPKELKPVIQMDKNPG